jgi:hypothetical protein
MLKVFARGIYSAKVMVTTSLRSTPMLSGAIPGVGLVAVMIRMAGRVVEPVGIKGIWAKKAPVLGSLSMIVAGILPVGSLMVSVAVGDEVAKTVTSPFPTAGRQ